MAAASGDDAGAGEAAIIFRPDGEELIDKFLRPKMSGEPLPAAARFIHDADVCSMPPGALTATYAPAPGPEGAEPVWYFFSPVHYYWGMRHVSVARILDGGVGKWSTKWLEHQKKEVDRCRGGWYRFLFGYQNYEAEQMDPPKWLMVEHGLTKEDAAQQQLVLCEVFRAPPPKPFRPTFRAPSKPSRPTRPRRAAPNQPTA